LRKGFQYQSASLPAVAEAGCEDGRRRHLRYVTPGPRNRSKGLKAAPRPMIKLETPLPSGSGQSVTLPDISRYLFHCAITHTRAYTLSQWCSRPSRSHQPFGFDSVFGRPCFRPSRLPQPFGFGSVFGRPYPRIRTPKPLYYASWTLPAPIFQPALPPL